MRVQQLPVRTLVLLIFAFSTVASLPVVTANFEQNELGKSGAQGGNPVNGLTAIAEVVERKNAKDLSDGAGVLPYFEVRFRLKNVSDQPISICIYPRYLPLKVEWIGPDGSKLQSRHYDWVKFLESAPYSAKSFVTIPPGGEIDVNPSGGEQGIYFWPGASNLFGDMAKPGKHQVTMSYTNKDDGKKFNLKKVWTGTVTAKAVVFTMK